MAIWCIFLMIILIVNLGICTLWSFYAIVANSASYPTIFFWGGVNFPHVCFMVVINDLYLSCLVLMAWLMNLSCVYVNLTI